MTWEITTKIYHQKFLLKRNDLRNNKENIAPEIPAEEIKRNDLRNNKENIAPEIPAEEIKRNDLRNNKENVAPEIPAEEIIASTGISVAIYVIYSLLSVMLGSKAHIFFLYILHFILCRTSFVAW